MEELRGRSSKEGLALIARDFEVIPFDQAPFRPPISVLDSRTRTAWSSYSGAIAWYVYGIDRRTLRMCPMQIIVEPSDGNMTWQVKGNVSNVTAVGVSADGKRVAFDGTFRPAATHTSKSVGDDTRSVTGLQLADAATGTVSLLSGAWQFKPDGGVIDRVGSISWAPSGMAFVYDFQEHIFIYDIETGLSRAIAGGSSAEWSPDGRRIAFHTKKDEASLIDISSLKIETIQSGGRILDSVHWSPDSRYLAFGEAVGFWSNVLHGRFPILGPTGQIVVYRIADKSSVPAFWFGFKGGPNGGFFWVKDYRSFLKNAANDAQNLSCTANR
jgi:WD40-like Beta Propeller Repeat